MSGFETDFYEAYGEGIKSYSWFDERSEYCTAITETSYGKGKIVAMLFDYGKAYSKIRSSALRNAMDDILCSVYTPMVRLNMKNLDVSMQEDGDKRIINLVNVGGDHVGGCASYDFVQPFYNVELTIDMQDKYTKITMPLVSDAPAEFVREGRFAKLKVDVDDIHQILILE